MPSISEPFWYKISWTYNLFYAKKEIELLLIAQKNVLKFGFVNRFTIVGVAFGG